MGMIFIHQKSKKQNRKPGWRKAEAEYAEWLSRTSTMPSGITGVRTLKTIGTAPKSTASTEAKILPAKYVLGSGTKPVPRPEIQYRENPEMLKRELIARERKFNVAPAYNKGGDTFVTEEQLQALLSSNKRRS